MDHDTMLEEEGAAVRGNPLKKAGKKVYSKGKVGLSTAHGVAEDFKNFINKGNVFDLAVGVIMGAAFTTIVKSLVDDIFTPIIGLISDKNLENMFFVLRCPEINVGDPPVKRRPGRAVCANSWKTVEEAHKDGAVTWNWGTFTQRVINFLLVSTIVFFMVKIYSAAFFRKDETKVKECPDCTKEIPIKAKRCPECTASLGSQSDLGERASLLSMKDL